MFGANLISSEIMRHSHARDQHHLEDVLGTGGWVSHGNVESPVDAEGHLPQVTLRLLAIAIIWYIDVGEHAMEVETCFLACNTTTKNLLNSIDQAYIFPSTLCC